MKKNNDKNSSLFVIGGVCFAVLLIITASLFLYFSGILKSNPKVTYHPKNTYDKTLRIVTDIDYEPFSYIDENGDYAGLDVELIAEIADRLEMNLDLKLMDWTAANEAFFNGEADGILNMETDLVTSDDRMIATIPTTEKQYVVYGRESINSVAELYGRNVASLHNLPELGLLDSITYIDSYASIFNGLKDGRYEFAICPIQVGNVFLDKLDMSDVIPSYAVNHVYGAIALASDNTELQRQMDEIIKDMTIEGRINELDQKWISNRYQNMTLGRILQSHPWIIVVFFIGLLFISFLLLVLWALNKNLREKDIHSRELQDKINIIDTQKKELTLSKEKAEASSKAKTTFLSNMSHDIRTPMNAIIGYTNLALQEDRSNDDMKKYLKKIKSSSQHLLALINDVLEMSRIESGKVELEEVPTDLKKILDGMNDMFATQMQEKNILYTVKYDGIKNQYVYCDENRLNRVLLNLVSNAYKFTPTGGKVSLTMTQNETYEDHAEYILKVKDSGIGMSKEFADKVFEAFERERTSTVSGIQGTGLGMAITKNIVDMMGGDIRVNTAVNEGSEFIVRLNLTLQSDVSNTDDNMNSSSADDEYDFSGMRLLLVEDMDINREIATALLNEMGFEVEAATNGKEAVDKVSESTTGYYDAVLMDIQMPVMNGYDATRNIRALSDDTLSKIPIIAMTANAFSEDIKKAHETGMNAHIAKPIDISAMTATLTEILG